MLVAAQNGVSRWKAYNVEAFPALIDAFYIQKGRKVVVPWFPEACLYVDDLYLFDNKDNRGLWVMLGEISHWCETWSFVQQTIATFSKQRNYTLSGLGMGMSHTHKSILIAHKCRSKALCRVRLTWISSSMHVQYIAKTKRRPCAPLAFRRLEKANWGRNEKRWLTCFAIY